MQFRSTLFPIIFVIFSSYDYFTSVAYAWKPFGKGPAQAQNPGFIELCKKECTETRKGVWKEVSVLHIYIYAKLEIRSIFFINSIYHFRMERKAVLYGVCSYTKKEKAAKKEKKDDWSSFTCIPVHASVCKNVID